MNAAEKALESLGYMGKERKEVYKGYMGFTKSIKTGSTIDPKTQELILTACSIMSQCDMCVSLHVQEAATLGATKDEIIDAAMLAIAMGGSPKMMYMRYVFEELEDLFG
jgi:AhpD family alkylhydroperoxidase